jgi:hypothetical protein
MAYPPPIPSFPAVYVPLCFFLKHVKPMVQCAPGIHGLAPFILTLILHTTQTKPFCTHASTRGGREHQAQNSTLTNTNQHHQTQTKPEQTHFFFLLGIHTIHHSIVLLAHSSNDEVVPFVLPMLAYIAPVAVPTAMLCWLCMAKTQTLRSPYHDGLHGLYHTTLVLGPYSLLLSLGQSGLQICLNLAWTRGEVEIMYCQPVPQLAVVIVWQSMLDT